MHTYGSLPFDGNESGWSAAMARPRASHRARRPRSPTIAVAAAGLLAVGLLLGARARTAGDGALALGAAGDDATTTASNVTSNATTTSAPTPVPAPTVAQTPPTPATPPPSPAPTTSPEILLYKRTHASADAEGDAAFLATYLGLNVTINETIFKDEGANGARGGGLCAKRFGLSTLPEYAIHLYESAVAPQGPQPVAEWVAYWRELHVR